MSTLNVLVTGGGGRIAYSLIPKICNGDIFGQRKISLRLLDIEQSLPILEGVKYEIEDSCYELLEELICSSDLKTTCSNVDVAILLGGYPRLPGMERKDLISKNAEGMKTQASALNSYAHPDCKIIVIANPANTNCLVAIKSCPNIPPQNFTCLTRLDEERFRNVVCEKVNQYYKTNADSKISPSTIQNICIFGNHSSTQVPFMEHGTCIYKGNKQLLPKQAFENQHNEIVKHIQTRGAMILEKLKNSSAMSCATAIEKHIKNWLIDEPGHDGNVFSMGILSDGSYGVPKDIVVSQLCLFLYISSI